jgi:hypothetical protein
MLKGMEQGRYMDLITQRLTLKDVLGEMRNQSPKLDELEGSYSDDTPFIRKGIVPLQMKIAGVDLDQPAGERSVVAIISTLAVDRDDEVILPEGMVLRDFDLNRIVMFGHNYHELPVGKAAWVKATPDDNPSMIMAKTIYASEKANPKAEQVFQFQKEGFPLAKSIGFIPLESKTAADKDWNDVLGLWRERRAEMFKNMDKAQVVDDKDPKRIYTKWSLLEYSDVPVPSNPEAVGIAVSKGLMNEEDAKKYLPTESPSTTLSGTSSSSSVSLFHSEEKPVIPLTKAEVLKPFPNEHACRLESPDSFDKFNRVNNDQESDGKRIDVIYGIKDGKSKIQALRYPKDIWTAESARSHCSGREGSFEAASKILEIADTPSGEDIDAIADKVAERLEELGKEGRVLSARTRRIMLVARDALNELLEVPVEIEEDSFESSETKIDEALTPEMARAILSMVEEREVEINIDDYTPEDLLRYNQGKAV